MEQRKEKIGIVLHPLLKLSAQLHLLRYLGGSLVLRVLQLLKQQQQLGLPLEHS